LDYAYAAHVPGEQFFDAVRAMAHTVDTLTTVIADFVYRAHFRYSDSCFDFHQPAVNPAQVIPFVRERDYGGKEPVPEGLKRFFSPPSCESGRGLGRFVSRFS